jgi:pilus assembly protein Flp/PilA
LYCLNLLIKEDIIMEKSLMHEEGQGLVEYALILVLVAIVVIAILLQLGPSVGNVFSSVIAGLTQTGHGVISSVSPPEVQDIGGGVYRLSMTVQVSQPTDVTLSAGGKSQTKGCGGTCSFALTNVPSSGSFTVTAAAGGRVSGSYP